MGLEPTTFCMATRGKAVRRDEEPLGYAIDVRLGHSRNA
jgi:hypothetical protein